MHFFRNRGGLCPGQLAPIVSFSSYGNKLVAKIHAAEMRQIEQVQEIKNQLLTGVKHYGPRKLIMDLSDLTFVSSFGFLAFLAVRREGDIGTIVFCNVDENVRQVFAMCHLISNAPGVRAPFSVQPTVEADLSSHGAN